MNSYEILIEISHGRKSDKETQSPVLKIFKDMMQKEKTDPEKVSLLMDVKNKIRDKKKTSYSDSRSNKTGHKSYDSSSTDRYKNHKHGKITVQNLQEGQMEHSSRDRSGSSTYQDGRRESWWFWRDNRSCRHVKKKSEDTYSCVSCALKSMIHSQYTCVCFLLILFAASVVVTFLLVFKNMPSSDEAPPEGADSQGSNLASKIQLMLKAKRQLTENYGYDFTEKTKWDDSLMNPVGNLPNMLGSEYTGNTYKESSIVDDLEAGMSGDLASILDNGKILEGQNNKKLREFFNKLLKTDAQIRRLKQSINNNNYNMKFDDMKMGRYKRSMKNMKDKHHIKPKHDKYKVNTKTKKSTSDVNIETNRNDKKRYATTGSDFGLSNYIIESKEVVIHYEPDKKRNFPKCSHTLEDKTHEKDLINPYYKHSQGIDDMLNPYTKFDVTTVNYDVIFGKAREEHLETTNATPDTDKDDESLIESITKMNTKLKTEEKSKEHENSAKKFDESNNHDTVRNHGKANGLGNIIKSNDKSNDRESGVNNYAIINDDESVPNNYDIYPESGFITGKEQDKRMGEKVQYRKFNDKTVDLNHRHLSPYVTTISTTASNEVTKRGKIETTSDLDYDMETLMSTTSVYGLDLTVSNLKDPLNDAVLKPKPARNQHMGHRKLLQDDEGDEEHEELCYEDLKEVLTDAGEGHDDTDKHADKKKRDNEEQFGVSGEFNQNKPSPHNIFNQNWKGPMPLYPDELNAMIKHAALQNLDIQVPVYTKDIKEKRNIDEKEISDTQYIEDYADDKYKKIIRMAQAYSDYGVLCNKKDNVNKMVKSNYFSRLFNKQNIFGNSKKDSTRATELTLGFEIRHGSTSNNKDFLNAIRKHIKISGKTQETKSTTLNPMEQPMNSNFEFEKLLTPPYNLLDTNLDISTTKSTPCLVLSIKKGPRNPESVEATNDDTGIMNRALSFDELSDSSKFNLADKSKEIIDHSSGLNLNKFNENVDEKEPLNVDSNNIAINDINNNNMRKCLRALKSIDITDKALSDTLNKTDTLELNAKNITMNNNINEFIDTINYTKALNKSHQSSVIMNVTNINPKNVTNGVTSFITIMANWFQTLARLSGETDDRQIKDSKRNTGPIFNKTAPKLKLPSNLSNDLMYPVYDLGMVDNIGHRSRALMSFDINSAVEDTSEIDKTTFRTNIDFKKAAFNSDIDEVVPVALVLATNDTEKLKEKSITAIDEHNENRTLAKRSIGENSVFWNDLYDNNEYGVKIDYVDDVRDPTGKHTRNILHKSKNWLQDKISNATHKFKGKWKKNTDQKITAFTTDNIAKTFNGTHGPSLVVKERYARDSDRTLRRNTKKNFAALNANMKRICQEAAKAIQSTKNIEVRENSKENAAATSLMQQLVRMMSDLVDIQVQQKTCAKLPSDLQNFLEWLTAPSDNIQFGEWAPMGNDYDDSIRFVKSTEPSFDYQRTVTEDSNQDDKTECLGTIRAVQDLIQQYDGLAAEEKNKITGVREYLENQLLFLNNKISNFYDTNVMFQNM